MSEKKRILDASTFSSKFQITLTKKVREAFYIKAGQGVIFMLEASWKVDV
jgi:bifunctional DNA-binding transcriptional regulator/antitoxin component of YhaV-PrlF toxin-antitoxin module